MRREVVVGEGNPDRVAKNKFWINSGKIYKYTGAVTLK